MFSSNAKLEQLADDTRMARAATLSTAAITLALRPKRKREDRSEDESTEAAKPASSHTPASSWHYATLAQQPRELYSLTRVPILRFKLLCRQVAADPAWEIRNHLIKDLHTPEDKILAACLLLNEQTRQDLREKLQCSEGTVYFIAQHLCPLVNKHLIDLSPGKRTVPVSSRKFLFDPETQLYYTPLAHEESIKARIRLPEVLAFAMPDEIKAEVYFRANRKKARVYLHSTALEETLENSQAAYEKVKLALQNKERGPRKTSSLFRSAQAGLNGNAEVEHKRRGLALQG